MSFKLLCVLLSAVSVVHGASAQITAAASSKPVLVTSPDGKVRAELDADGGMLTYKVSVDGQMVLEPSKLGIRSDDVELGEGVTLGTAKRHRVNEQYRFFGAHSVAHNEANEAAVAVRTQSESYTVDLHVADDGVAVRLRLPARPGRKVQADHSSWKLQGNPTMWVDKLDASYESPYHTSSLSDLGTDVYGMPLTARVGGVYITLTEAELKDYGDLALRPGADGALEGELHWDPQGWTTDDAVVQPWRVTVIAHTLTELVNTTLVQNLNPPAAPQLQHAAWILPGRSSWQWLSSGDPRQEEQTQWVDWTSQLGFEYYLIDEGWSHWQNPWPSITQVVSYAKTKKVKIWIWVHSREVMDEAARKEYFRKAVAAGVVGVKIDFPPPCSRAISNWYFATAKDAAAAHLMVDFHGANKPTGMNRTWPNVLTREGVRGHEYHITRYHRVLAADHDVILPFTRYIAGPGDYTPTVFTPKELVGNTWAHELAQSVIFTSPFLCFGGHPQSYLENPARDVIMAVPPTWDETRVLQGSEPGKVVAEARRSGKRWFIAVINGGEASHLDIPLDFLGAGTWKSSFLRDSADRPDAFDRKDGTTTRAAHLQLDLTPRGGFVGWVRP